MYHLIHPTASPSSPPSSSSSSSHAQSSSAPSSSAAASANASRQPSSRAYSTLHTASISVAYTISERNRRCGIRGSRGRVERGRTAGGILWCAECSLPSSHLTYIYVFLSMCASFTPSPSPYSLCSAHRRTHIRIHIVVIPIDTLKIPAARHSTAPTPPPPPARSYPA